MVNDAFSPIRMEHTARSKPSGIVALPITHEAGRSPYLSVVEKNCFPPLTSQPLQLTVTVWPLRGTSVPVPERSSKERRQNQTIQRGEQCNAWPRVMCRGVEFTMRWQRKERKTQREQKERVSCESSKRCVPLPALHRLPCTHAVPPVLAVCLVPACKHVFSMIPKLVRHSTSNLPTTLALGGFDAAAAAAFVAARARPREESLHVSDSSAEGSASERR